MGSHDIRKEMKKRNDLMVFKVHYTGKQFDKNKNCLLMTRH